MDRREFLLTGAVTVSLPLAGCGGGADGGGLPAIATQPGPTAMAGAVRFQARPEEHTLVITPAAGPDIRAGGPGTAPGKLNFPNGVAVHDGLAYVVETGNHRVQVFDAKGTAVRAFGQDTLLYPGDIAAMGGEIFVSDSRHGRIAVFTPLGELKRTFGDGKLSAPRGLAAIDNTLLVADPGLRRVMRLDTSGNVLGEFGSGWVLPWDVATDGAYVFVADVSANRVAVLSNTGAPLDDLQLAKAPRYISYRDGTLFVV